MQQEIEGQPRAVSLDRFGEMERVGGDRERSAGGNDIDMVAFDRQAIGGLNDVHGCMGREQLDHHTLMRRIEVLNQDESHTWIGGHCVQ